MGLFNKYSISILLVTLGSSANAELFNYDYVDLKAGTTSSKAGDREYSLEVSKSIHRNIARDLMIDAFQAIHCYLFSCLVDVCGNQRWAMSCFRIIWAPLIPFRLSKIYTA